MPRPPPGPSDAILGQTNNLPRCTDARRPGNKPFGTCTTHDKHLADYVPCCNPLEADAGALQPGLGYLQRVTAPQGIASGDAAGAVGGVSGINGISGVSGDVAGAAGAAGGVGGISGINGISGVSADAAGAVGAAGAAGAAAEHRAL